MPSSCGAEEDSWESWTARRSNQSILKKNQPWIYIGRTDAEAPILWPPDAKSSLTRKYPDAGKDCRQEEKGTTEDEMLGWHHWLNGREFEQAPGGGEGQESLVCYSPWDCKESDTAEQLNNKNLLRQHVQPSHWDGSWVLRISLHGPEIPRWLSGKEATCRCRRCVFNPWVGKIPWGRKRQPMPVFLPEIIPWTEKPGELVCRVTRELDTTEWLSTLDGPIFILVGWFWGSFHGWGKRAWVILRDCCGLFSKVT